MLFVMPLLFFLCLCRCCIFAAFVLLLLFCGSLYSSAVHGNAFVMLSFVPGCAAVLFMFIVLLLFRCCS